MYLHKDMEIARNYDVIDVDSGIAIPCVQEADDETGKFTCYLRNNNGSLIINKLEDEVVIFHFKGNIKLVKKEEKNGSKG
jgi:hypothetical protein